MAETVERETKFRDAALVIADDLADAASRLRKYIRSRHYDKAEHLANAVQCAARDTKWLMRRLPKG